MSDPAPAVVATGRALDFIERARSANAAARVDAATARVVNAFDAAGVRSILLKGPALTRWLYADGAPRPYVDADLLVHPEHASQAESRLAELGFGRVQGPEDLPGFYQPQSLWTGSRQGETIDLHWGLGGTTATNDVVFEELAADTQRLEVGGSAVEALGPAALALHVALHAVKHASLSRPREDLIRALRVADRETWQGAAELAARVGVQDMFAAGLALDAAGVELAAALGLHPAASTDSILMSTSAAPGALVLEAFASAPTLRAKAWLAVRTLVPTRTWITNSTARGGRGGLWLAASYAWHPFGVLLRAGPAIGAWLRARAASRTPLGGGK